MFKLDSEYSDYTDVTDAAFPLGKAIDASTDEGVDGTPLLAKWMNQIHGAFTSLWFKAFGDVNGISGNADSIEKSDVLTAIEKLISNQLDKMLIRVSICGYETLITWASLGRNYDESVAYAAVAFLDGKNEEFLPLETEVSAQGIKVFCRHYDEDGKIVQGTKMITWGEKNWGEFNWGENTAMAVNLIIREVA